MNFTYVSQGIPESIMKAGAVYKYDLSIPVEKMYDLVEEMRVRLGNQTNDLFFFFDVLLHLGKMVRHSLFRGWTEWNVRFECRSWPLWSGLFQQRK